MRVGLSRASAGMAGVVVMVCSVMRWLARALPVTTTAEHCA